MMASCDARTTLIPLKGRDMIMRKQNRKPGKAARMREARQVRRNAVAGFFPVHKPVSDRPDNTNTTVFTWLWKLFKKAA